MRLSGPPRDVLPAYLFSSLMERRPRQKLEHRCAAFPEVELWARAIPGASIVSAVRSDRVHRITALSLCDADGEQLFKSADSLLLLSAKDLRPLRVAVDQALATICPTYSFSDWQAWHMTLSQGLEGNSSLVTGMANCFDISIGYGAVSLTERPDRYFGCPMSELLDGHLMAFAAVRDWMKTRRG